MALDETTPVVSQGRRANTNGQAAEMVIAAMLDHQRQIYLRQARIGKGIYGTPLYADFFLPYAAGYPNGFCIESKWQEVAGSADEKLPYLVTNIRECYPCPVVVVLHGGGFRPGAEAWLRRQIDEHLCGVFRLEEFLTWCNRTLFSR